MTDDAVEDFWTAGELNEVTLGEFVARLNAYPPSTDEPRAWARTGQPHHLGPVPRVARQSARRFGHRQLTADEVGTLFAAFAADEQGRRPYAAAGALYGVHVIGFLLSCDHLLNGRVVAHHPTQHALYDIGRAPEWAELAGLIGGRDADGAPALALALFVDDTRLRAKYGPRGARFALLEAGAALHQLALAAAGAGLVGYATGGGLDAALRHLAGLPRSARFASGYLVGADPFNGGRAWFGAGARRRRRTRAPRSTQE